MSSTPRLSPELARQDPEEYKSGVIQHLGNTTAYGSRLVEFGREMGLVDPNNITIVPHTFHSDYRHSTGELRLGAADLPPDLQDRIHYQPTNGEKFTYADSVAWRLGHEIGHAVLSDARILAGNKAVTALRSMTMRARDLTNGRRGYSALGSLDFYGTPDFKAREDASELLMAGVKSPHYLKRYADLLASTEPRHQLIRANHGLIRVTDPDKVHEAVMAVIDDFMTQPRKPVTRSGRR